jgi:hypothetical protein
LETLRDAIRDESLSMTERRTAAEHYNAALTDAVQEPADDHPEVVELRTPWKDDGPLGNIAPMAWKQRNISYEWSADGPTLTQAIKRVHDRLKLRALLAVVVDDSAHKLERLEASRRVLDDHLHPQSFERKNGYDAERMLSKVLPTTATKYGGWNRPPVPVVRPPRDLADVW